MLINLLLLIHSIYQDFCFLCYFLHNPFQDVKLAYFVGISPNNLCFWPVTKMQSANSGSLHCITSSSRLFMLSTWRNRLFSSRNLPCTSSRHCAVGVEL